MANAAEERDVHETTQTDTAPPTPAVGAVGTTDTSRPVLRAVEPAAVHSSAERRLAVEQWLLSSVPGGRDRARMEWQEHAVTMLPPGTLFSAVRLPGDLVLAAACSSWNPEVIDPFLDETLEGGPVICDLHQRRYYVLVPASMPATWTQAAEEWRPLGVECLGRGTIIGVPRVDVTESTVQGIESYWSVPMSSAAMLCSPLHVARLIAAGVQRLGIGGEV
ncbi:hypothetical protein [Streptomyces sp. NPDC101776]|uniref:hypothetical protein n=1 Tax=Streptomyces sp. NPDC101776 TaxID=3366146 RepID=UPI00382FF521